MRGALGRPVRAAGRRIREDLRADPYLLYILLLATVLAYFWIWHRLPNFATRDERWRVVDPVETAAYLGEELSLDSLRQSFTGWRNYGATFYVAAFALVPVAVAVLATDQVGSFLDMGRHRFVWDNDVWYWEQWRRTPGWIWTASVLPVRLVNASLAVASVYVMYRIGTTMRDRAAGRLAALLLTVTWGVLVLAHEAGEDLPAMFFTLLAFYFALRYVESGRTRTYYWGCVAGALGIGMKLSAGVSVIVLGVAFFIRAKREHERIHHRYVRPLFLLGGVGIGVGVIWISYPSVLVEFDPQALSDRISRGSRGKDSPHGWRVKPSWWWILRGYLHGLGLPLFVAGVASSLGSLTLLRERSPAADGVRLAAVGIGSLLALVSPWAYVRMHHLLLSFPFVIVLVTAVLFRIRDRRPPLGRALMAVLLITSGVYAIGGDLAYASQPRDQATQFIADRATPNTTVETYLGDPQEAAVPHDIDISRGPRGTIDRRCPDYIVLSYHEEIVALAPDSWSKRARTVGNERTEQFYRDLLAEDTYPYEVAKRFGRQPRFLEGMDRRSTWRELLHVGLRPRTHQYGDPQDFGEDQYTVVLRATDDCGQ
ncbi:MAG: ArnT family glycosyltransferase [Halobacteriales archaeon]